VIPLQAPLAERIPRTPPRDNAPHK
jgi:hypothetical protein